MPRFPDTAASSHSLSDGVFGKLQQRQASATQRVYSLHVGDTYLEPLRVARAEAQLSEAIPRLHNYAPTQGEPELLRAIVNKLKRRSGVDVDVATVQVMAGATGAMGVICNTLLEAADEVILPAPFWPLMRGAVRARGGKPVEVPLFTRLDEPGFDPVAAIEAAITQRTCAIYLNTPHNPTGRVLSEAAISGIAQLAEKHRLWIIGDDVYEDVYFGSKAPQSIFARPDCASRTIASHSVSKAYALAGARVGYTHGPREVMDVIRGVQTFFTFCAPRPMQFGAALALEQGDGWLANMRSVYGRAGKLAAEALEIPPPEGGTFLFFDLKPFLRRGETPTELLERCLDGGVMLTPGTACGTDYASWARLCFTTVPEPELEAALACLRAVLFR